MGLSSSQARLLNMTSRMHQIEYKAAKLEAQKLQMANESRRVYEEYLDALETTKVQVKHIESDGSATYKDITGYSDFTGAGFALMYANTVYDGKDGKKLFNLANAAFKPATSYTADSQLTNVEQIITNLINTGDVVIVEKQKNASGALEFPTNGSVTDIDRYETSIAINTNLQEVPDESQLRKAEAKYEADMRKIDAKDRKYDADLAALDTERNAIKSEMETLKTVARDNVERTFKLFS